MQRSLNQRNVGKETKWFATAGVARSSSRLTKIRKGERTFESNPNTST